MSGSCSSHVARPYVSVAGSATAAWRRGFSSIALASRDERVPGFLGDPRVVGRRRAGAVARRGASARTPDRELVNLVEVYYRAERDHGRAAADETLASLRAALAPDLPGTARMIDVARLKSRGAIALGDCFAVATAAAHDVVLLTGDPEIIGLPDPPCRVEDLGG